MTRQDIAILTLRAFALYAWFKALQYFADGTMSVLLANLYQVEQRLTAAAAITAFAPSLIFFLAGIVVFVRSRALASWLLPPSNETPADQLAPHPLPTATVAFAVIGVAVFLYAAPRALEYAIPLTQIAEAKDRAERFSRDAPHIIAAAMQLILGFVLFLNARKFATVWWRKQQLPKPPQ